MLLNWIIFGLLLTLPMKKILNICCIPNFKHAILNTLGRIFEFRSLTTILCSLAVTEISR